MRIGILSRDRTLYSTHRLREAGEQRGHEIQIVDYLRCTLNIKSQNPSVIYRVAQIDFDAIIPRIGASRTFYGTAVVRQFEMMGVLSANESQAITRSRDKLRCLQLLSREGVGLPVTGFAHSPKDIGGLITSVGEAPLVVKLLEATQGIGVVLAETRQAAESVIAAFRQLNANILVQEFIQDSRGSDIRVLVVEGEAKAAMMRRGAPGEFRSNLHRGGTAEQIELTPQERASAERAARAIGLNFAGVDMLRTREGPVILEVNSSPGLRGIEQATGKDVAGAVIDFLERSAAQGKQRNRGNG
jgi:ribosomal protein S6--L-glutamate ligase